MFPKEETQKLTIGVDIWITTAAGLVDGLDATEPQFAGFWSLKKPLGSAYGEATKESNGKTRLFSTRDEARVEAQKAATEMIKHCQRGQKNARPPLTPEQRVNLFLGFCTDLTRHPIIEWSRNNPQTTMSFSFPENGDDKVSVNFDTYHLESLLTRLRQFVSPKEVFFFNTVHDAVDSLIGEKDGDWDSLCNNIESLLHATFPKQPFEALKANGEPVIEGRTYEELLGTRLYTGAIHSKMLAVALPRSSDDGWKNANEVCRAQLNTVLVPYSLIVCQQVMNLRRQILKRWIAADRLPNLPLLAEFEELVSRVEG